MSNNGIVRHNELYSFMYLSNHRMVRLCTAFSPLDYFLSALIPGEFESGYAWKIRCKSKAQLFAYVIKTEIARILSCDAFKQKSLVENCLPKYGE